LSDTLQALLARCHANSVPLNEWEAGFLADIAACRREISPKQIGILQRIANRIDPAGIATLLADQSEGLATFLRGAPPTFREREELRYGTKGSFVLAIGGQKRGHFYDHEARVGGDCLGMIQHIRHYDAAAAIAWAKNWLGLEHIDVSTLPPAPPPAPLKIVEPKKTVPLARAIWAEAVSARGSIVERYLASRGLALPPGAPIKNHPACPRGEEKVPAMVSLMSDAVSAAPCGIHRTYLAADGTGKARGQAKLMLGGGGVIRLAPDEDVTVGLGVTEGIENALAIMSRGWSPVWAAGSAGAISTFPVLTGIECLTIFADADENGAGIKAARACGTRWAAAGRQVDVHYPPAGTDWNDVTLRSAA
jgi:putative DNA primase/helicase